MMKLKLLLGMGFWMMLLLLSSCKNDDLNFNEQSSTLRFSQDTLFCDTVYNHQCSETYFLTVYNTENKDVTIPKISLKEGTSSKFRINVDGRIGTDFSNIPIRKKDSLYIFVEVFPHTNTAEFLAKDEIIFKNKTSEQKISLFSVVQDAEYFIESDTNPNILSQDTRWDNKKIKIIMGILTVAKGKKLEIQEGTKVYFTQNSSLKISSSASLIMNGQLGKEVVMKGERNSSRYDSLPLNWKGISLDENAILKMNYAKLYGGEVGLYLNKTKATISNTVIHTFYKYGIYAMNSKIDASNLVMNNVGDANIALFGGELNLTHSTIANYWNLNSLMNKIGIYATNQWTDNTGKNFSSATRLSIKNSIIYGDGGNTVVLRPYAGIPFNYLISHSLLRYSSNDGYQFNENTNVVNSIQNSDPLFQNTSIRKMNLRVSAHSPAKTKGSTTIAKDVPFDIVGQNRTQSPTMGAYQ